MKTKKTKASPNGPKMNTHLCVDLKTIMKHDVLLKPGTIYCGVLTHDVVCEDYVYDDSHYTFVECALSAPRKRNPKVFEGKYISLTRRADGSLHPNFKTVEIDANFNIERFARGVSHELRLALRGLVVRRGSRV